MADLKYDSTRITGEMDRYITGCNAAISGYCDLSDIPGLPFPDLTTGISLGINLDPGIVLSLKNGPDENYAHEYSRVNSRLANLAEKVSGFLRDKGYNTGFIPPTENVTDPERLFAEFPHKTAATSAGLGWIGKNAIFVTKKYGSAVRIITVFTDAPLVTAEPVVKSYCGECSLCRDICPAGAISGRNWSGGMSRDELLDARKCFEQSRKKGYETGAEHAVCGVCIAVCPWTDKYLKREGLLQ